ncbi:hypothetical protein Sya03_31830 [Spirilliplanes yamanashiensis]|uniref:Uncharacterized protein n=1 Tax=Spirilliplanes yamanashiensis TaxID=42233 RepID=A0A8J3Y8A3_9ACTN|nr:hypothetical protein Sya03_31830 [Spirilliplanes yamanashiensis]
MVPATARNRRAKVRRLDVLGLAAVAARRHDHAPGDGVGDGGALFLTPQVQAQVDAGGGAGRGVDGLVVDVQHAGVSMLPDGATATTSADWSRSKPWTATSSRLIRAAGCARRARRSPAR